MGQARSPSAGTRTRKPKASKPAAPQAETKATTPETPAKEKVKDKLPKLVYDMSLLKGIKLTKDGVVSILKKDNPHRSGSRVHTAFGLYREGMTLEDFTKRGGLMADVRQHICAGYIKVAIPVPEAVEV